MSLFVVCMDSFYVRDAQYLNTSGLSDGEFAIWSDNRMEQDNWVDMEPNVYIGIFKAKSEEEACHIAGKEKRYDPCVLYAIKITNEGE